jgi:hypothetical protein
VAQEPETAAADDPMREPEIQDLLPLEEKNTAETPEPGTEDDSDEDLGIPAFMRRRMRARRQNPQ